MRVASTMEGPFARTYSRKVRLFRDWVKGMMSRLGCALAITNRTSNRIVWADELAMRAT